MHSSLNVLSSLLLCHKSLFWTLSRHFFNVVNAQILSDIETNHLSKLIDPPGRQSNTYLVGLLTKQFCVKGCQALLKSGFFPFYHGHVLDLGENQNVQ